MRSENFLAHAIKRTFDYAGNTTRKQFWLWTLTVAAFGIAWFSLVLEPLNHSSFAANFETMRFLIVLPFLIAVPSSIAVMVRRVRDAGRRPRVLLWLLAPVAAIPVLLLITSGNPWAGFYITFVAFCVMEICVGIYLLYVFCLPSNAR